MCNSNFTQTAKLVKLNRKKGGTEGELSKANVIAANLKSKGLSIHQIKAAIVLE